MEFQKGELIKIVYVDQIKQGEYLWSNDDIVEIRDVEEFEDRIEVWNVDKTLSELIYINEFKGIKKIS